MRTAIQRVVVLISIGLLGIASFSNLSTQLQGMLQHRAGGPMSSAQCSCCCAHDSSVQACTMPCCTHTHGSNSAPFAGQQGPSIKCNCNGRTPAVPEYSKNQWLGESSITSFSVMQGCITIPSSEVPNLCKGYSPPVFVPPKA